MRPSAYRTFFVLILIFAISAIFATTACTLLSRQKEASSTKADPQSRSIAVARGQIVDGSGYAFNTTDTSCGGFPALKVQTMPGTCLGMVISQNGHLDTNGKPKLKMPRLIVAVPGTEHFLITDMGGWSPRAGSLVWLKHRGGTDYSLVKILEKLDLPHGLAFNERDQCFYLGENRRIIRFRLDPEKGEISSQQTVIDNMADTAKHMHPLTHFVFSPATGDLYINSGASTDHCYQSDGQYKKRCPEEVQQRMATIQRISHDKLASVTGSRSLQPDDIEVVAQGLRNSMAMAIHQSGRFLIQGENSRDFPEPEEPYEEMNVIRLDQPKVVRHYGWPYCYNNHAGSPEWEDILIKEGTEYTLPNSSSSRTLHGPNPFYCGRSPIQGLKDYQRPSSLIPPHAAPLAAGYYQGAMFADQLSGQLLMSWHGHRTTGQRFVAYRTNGQGLPILSKPENETYNFSLPNGCTKKAPFSPRGGHRQHFARYQEIISGWGPVKGMRPKGTPVGFATGNDGAIWIVEDKNKAIVRLAKSQSAGYQPDCGDTPGTNKDFNVPLLVWRNALLGNEQSEVQLRVQYNEISRELRKPERCLKCHESLINKDLGETPDEMTTLDFFVRSGWLVPGDPDKSLLYGALTGNGMAPEMPPSGFDSLRESAEGRNLLETLRVWISNLPKDIDSRWTQIKVSKRINIRPAPTTKSTPCGQFQADDIAYVDPRRSARISANGYNWSKVYLLPGHTRLSPGACPHPLDGVYYMVAQ